MAGCCRGDIYIPKVFSECCTLEMQIRWLGAKYTELDERVTALEEAQGKTNENTNEEP